MVRSYFVVLFLTFGLIFCGVISKHTSKPDIIDAIEGDPDVIGNISPKGFEELDDLKDQSLSDTEKLQKAQQILKSDSGVKDLSDNIIRRVSNGNIDTSGLSGSVNNKIGSTSGSFSNIGSGLNSGNLLSKIKDEFEANYDKMYDTLDSKAKAIADEISNELQDSGLSLSEITSEIKSIISSADSTVQKEIKNLLPSELNIDTDDTTKKLSISDKFNSIKNGVKSIFSKHSTTETW
uniref:DUF148 domain-containing protein n=1 Tax=Strongyloides venezuelensis TaxID=75913 RepID=A0A0K0EWI7_STRVS